MRTKGTAHTGFTLLEVLLAVMVLGLALTVFFSAANQGLAAVAQMREYQISRELLDELTLREPLNLVELEVGVTRGSFTHSEHGRVSWTRTLETVGEEDHGFFKLTVEVSRGDGRGDGGVALRESLETFIHQPSAVRGGWVEEPFDEL